MLLFDWLLLSCSYTVIIKWVLRAYFFEGKCLLLVRERLSSESSRNSNISCWASSSRCCLIMYISFLASRASWATTRYSFSMRSCSCRHWVRGFSIWVVSVDGKDTCDIQSYHKQRQGSCFFCFTLLPDREESGDTHCWCGRCSRLRLVGHKPPPTPEAVHLQHSQQTSAAW